MITLFSPFPNKHTKPPTTQKSSQAEGWIPAHSEDRREQHLHRHHVTGHPSCAVPMRHRDQALASSHSKASAHKGYVHLQAGK